MKGFFANIIKLLKGESSGSGSKHLATEAPTSTAAETKKAGDDTMAENRSIVIKAAGVAVIEDAPIPKLRDNYVIVKTKAVAINPTDWKHIDRLAPIGARVGCDYAGEVVEVGPNLSKAFEKGDRIAGMAHGSNSLNLEDGTFAYYIAAKTPVAIKIPPNISDIEAATFGIATSTVGQGLYQDLKLPLPTSPAETPFPILIYGGSTAMGVAGIQFAKASGLTVIATASPKNFDYVKSLGASFVFDYRSPTVVEDIKKAAGQPLLYAWDCVAEDDTVKLCAAALATEAEAGPGKRARYSALLGIETELINAINPNVVPTGTIAYTAVGEPFKKGKYVAAVPEDMEFAKGFWDLARGLYADGTVKPIKTLVDQEGKGLEGVLKGLDLLRNGKVSAAKLVYTMP